MINKLISAIFRCRHERTTFPLTPRNQATPKQTYIVCLDCGREFNYDLNRMKAGATIQTAIHERVTA